MHNCGNPWHDWPFYLLMLFAGGGGTIIALRYYGYRIWKTIKLSWYAVRNHIHVIRYHGPSKRNVFIPEPIRYRQVKKNWKM